MEHSGKIEEIPVLDGQMTIFDLIGGEELYRGSKEQCDDILEDEADAETNVVLEGQMSFLRKLG